MFHSLPNDKILDQSKLKAFADNKINVTQKLKFVSERTENILGKGENAGYQHFLLFPKCFQSLLPGWGGGRMHLILLSYNSIFFSLVVGL